MTSIFATPINVAYVTSQGRQTMKLQASGPELTRKPFYLATDEKPKMVSFDPGYQCLTMILEYRSA